jgi:cholesterol oxidase
MSARDPERDRFDAVVIGSGFGGCIAALRLAQAGKRIVVLERGRRYAPGEFPRDPRQVDRIFWRWPARPAAQGLFDLRFFSGASALVASGVGGGSLVYANINIRPDADVFDDPRWPRAITRRTLEPYFDRVAAMLGVGPVPASHLLSKRDAFHAAAQRLHRPVFDPDQAVSWKACKLCSQCEFGCQHGAKNSADRTYLAQAEAYGVEVRPGVAATTVERLPGDIAGGGYRVHFKRTDGGEGSVVGARVVLSAGTLGTTEILLRSRDEARTLPLVSARLGHGYSANGDFLGNIENSTTDLAPWSGPDVTSVMRFSGDGPSFTVAAPGFTRGVTSVLASLGQPRLKWLRAVAPAVRPFLGQIVPWMFEHGMMSKPLFFKERNAGDPSRMTNLFAIGRDNAGGRLLLRRGQLDMEWDFARENADLVRRMKAAMTEIGKAYGGTFAPLSLWDAFQRILTVHSLGGCRMAERCEDGVVSPDGEVFSYPGLFVADGSVVPTSIGFHPAMTISALSERIAERVVASYS